ncbi:hypothetical protein HGRIS_014454 [Hohenbuehelia grisea]|uniref:Uncharacterized protein n=1 Tax=Hohenbuehelia grisea TaxID=104357 RepID=A0ABR3JVF4_9AGAR
MSLTSSQPRPSSRHTHSVILILSHANIPVVIQLASCVTSISHITILPSTSILYYFADAFQRPRAAYIYYMLFIILNSMSSALAGSILPWYFSSLLSSPVYRTLVYSVAHLCDIRGYS